MRKTKKANNYFEKPILHESLFHEEVQKEYRIGGKRIQKGWLKDQPPQVYRANVKSAFEVAELRQQYENLQERSKYEPIDMFKLAELRQKIDNFERLDLSPKKQFKQNFKIEQSELKVQKISDFWGIFERNCRISDQTMYIDSQKDKKQKPVDLLPYSLEIQYLNKPNKDSKLFLWPKQRNVRLFLYGQNLRSFCLYSDEKNLKQIAKKLKLKKMQKKDTSYFKQLYKNYEQKIYINFGNKLRAYEKMMSEMENTKIQAALKIVDITRILEMVGEKEKTKKNLQEEERLKNIQVKKSKARHLQKSGFSEDSIIKSNENRSNSSLIAPNSPLRNTSNDNSSIFRMRTRRSTIFYDEIDDDDVDGPAPDYKVSDINLQIKEVALSDEDQRNHSSEGDESGQDNKMEEDISIKIKSPISPFKKQNNMKEVPILQLQQQYSSSELQSLSSRHKKVQDQSKCYTINEAYEQKLIFYLRIGYFQQFLPFSDKQITMTLIQKATPEYEYANMKMQACSVLTFHLLRQQQNPKMYVPTGPIVMRICPAQSDFCLILEDGIQNMNRLSFSIDCPQIKYERDESQLVYFKTSSKAIKMCGKLKIIVSNAQIHDQKLKEEPTIQFLDYYLFSKSTSHHALYYFIDYKKRHHQVCQQWRNKMLLRTIKAGDQREFFKAVFYGIPKNIQQKLLKVANNKHQDKSSLVLKKIGSQNLSTQFLKKIIDEICHLQVYDLRIFMKISVLVDIAIQSEKNMYLSHRLQQVCEYYRMRRGMIGVEKVLIAFVVQVLKKLQPILMDLKNEAQVRTVLSEYYNIQYQIDPLFASISCYFN